MAIKKFKKEETNKKNAIKIVSAFMVIGIMLAGISYAVYQHEDEKLFINAKVGEFKENDIELAIKLDGEQIDTPPAKDNYIVTVDCDYADGEWDSEKWGALVTNINANKVKCEVNFKSAEPTISEVTATSTKTSISLSYESKGVNVRTTCEWGTEEGEYPNEVEATNSNCTIEGLEMDTLYYYQVCAINKGGNECKVGLKKTETLADRVELGDYISMTPTSTSYTIPASLTGYSSNQTINPSELNLWRVIKKNEDGTVDMVSEYASSTLVYFRGSTGYLNLVGGLNEIAAQYTNSKYVSKTRHMGYSNQIEYCRGPLLYGNTGDCVNDTGYQIDINIVQSAMGTLLVKNPSGIATPYWLPSRFYYDSGTHYWYHYRRVAADGEVGSGYLYAIYVEGGPGDSFTNQFALRPIITLKSSTEVNSGDGKSLSTAYQLS